MACLDLPPVDPVIASLGYHRPDEPINVRWCSWDDWFAYCCPQAHPCANHRSASMPGLVRDLPHRRRDYNIDDAARRVIAQAHSH